MNEVTTRKRTRRSRAEWRSIIARYESSGLTGTALCEAEGIPKSGFWDWRRWLSEESGAAASATAGRSDPPGERRAAGVCGALGCRRGWTVRVLVNYTAPRFRAESILASNAQVKSLQQ